MKAIINEIDLDKFIDVAENIDNDSNIATRFVCNELMGDGWKATKESLFFKDLFETWEASFFCMYDEKYGRMPSNQIPLDIIQEVNQIRILALLLCVAILEDEEGL